MSLLRRNRRGNVTLEYLLLSTIVGLGVIVGLVAVRDALVDELQDVASGISQVGASPSGSDFAGTNPGGQTGPEGTPGEENWPFQ